MTPPAHRSFSFQPPQYITQKNSDPPPLNITAPPQLVINDSSLNFIFSISRASFFLKLKYSHHFKPRVQTCEIIFHGLGACYFTGRQGCRLFSPKQGNGQDWKVYSNFLSTVNDLKNFNWSFGSINDIVIEQSPSCLLNLVKVFGLTMSLLLNLFCENLILFLK